MGTEQDLAERRSIAQPTIKTILFHVIGDELTEQRIETALALARACSAHLSCLHVTPIEAYSVCDSLGSAFVMTNIVEALQEGDTELQAKMEKHLSGEDVSWDYEQWTGNVASAIVGRAALADLLITARSSSVGSALGFLGDLLTRSRTPLFVAGSDGRVFDPVGKALIAWNGSFEAANAVRAAFGLMRLASEVRVLQISDEKPSSETFPATRLLEYLSRQGIHAELISEPPAGRDPGHDQLSGMILAEANREGAAYIVMGGYSHSRAGEFVFGGVTRTLLNECALPLVIAR